ncbi:MAG: general secretion pathway protein GspB [bacterium]|nr:general secretion pathway protein GspB [bacterium]
MDAQKKKIAIIVVLFVAAGGLLYWQMFGPDPEYDAYMANAAKSQQDLATQQAGGGAAPPRPAAAAPTAARVVTAPASRFKTAEVDPVELLGRVQDVEFNYDENRTARDPMAPLVGPMARPLLAVVSDDPEGEKVGPSMEERLAVRTMALSGIVYDDVNPVAVVDNEVVTQGFSFPNGVVVEKIEADRVIMRVNEALIPIELKEL